MDERFLIRRLLDKKGRKEKDDLQLFANPLILRNNHSGIAPEQGAEDKQVGRIFSGNHDGASRGTKAICRFNSSITTGEYFIT
jgi:hypothetical protein